MGKNPIQVFLGVDGGGSNTRALLVDQNGGRISEGNSLGSNPHNGGYHLAASSINEAVQATIENAAPAQIKIESAFCGIAGIRNAEEQELLAKELRRFPWANRARLGIDHDVSIAYAAVLGAKPGITLICGTGSSCLGKDLSGKTILTSGRTEIIDDPGSGYAIGLEAIEAGLFQELSNSRNDIAKLAPKVIDLAQNGIPAAQNILNRNADALVSLIQDTHSKIDLGDTFNLGIIGGLGTSDTLYQKILLEKVVSQFPEAAIRFTKTTPVEAAARLALR
ncbi:MAG: glucosamine kinase [Candidatus Pelagisphaera sp.]